MADPSDTEGTDRVILCHLLLTQGAWISGESDHHSLHLRCLLIAKDGAITLAFLQSLLHYIVETPTLRMFQRTV